MLVQIPASRASAWITVQICCCCCFNFTLFYFTILYWFCHTSAWIHYGCICVPNPEPLSPYHPSGSSQCTSPKHPVSCIEPRLTICLLHDIIHVSMPFSQIIPPLPSPLPQSPKVCSVHPCLFCCLTYRVIVTIFLNSIYMRSSTVLMFFFLAYFTLYNQLQFHPSH